MSIKRAAGIVLLAWVFGFVLTFLAILILGGCGRADDGSNNHGYGYQVTSASTDTGIATRSANADSLTIGEIDALYRKTAARMHLVRADGSMPMPPRFVLFVAPPVDSQDLRLTGKTWGDGTIAIDSRLKRHPAGLGVWCIAEHELVHWLLFVTTGDIDPDHRAGFEPFGLFNDCTKL